jgi:hypothetical protein
LTEQIESRKEREKNNLNKPFEILSGQTFKGIRFELKDPQSEAGPCFETKVGGKSFFVDDNWISLF